MPTFTVKVDVTEDDKAHLRGLAELSSTKRSEKWRAYVVGDRSRTIDQIKRLYAVVIGLALLHCINNAIYCVIQDKVSSIGYSILTGEVICFVSLIGLFALGAERMLDRRYLRYNSRPATRGGLSLDLFTMAAPAIWFVVLANIFPRKNISDATLQIYLGYFVWALIGLYIIDIILLVVHRFLVSNNKSLAHAYAIWILINISTLSLVIIIYCFAMDLDPVSVPYFGIAVSLPAILLSVLHIVRFFVDFRWTFPFYYPDSDPNSTPPDDFT